ncbi:MAG: hypothetical protein H0T89_00875 [Deltaproteobacteria bacterium]|nr:hypothetical protein [Deltaproteobacteria bacterium]MDQ3300758.1 hypothetical protein [Myxococcota bacterium]
MARTFVRVELIEPDNDAYPPLWEAMGEQGFVRTIVGKKTGKPFRLPKGFYLIEKTTPQETLEKAKLAITKAKVEARIFCVPSGPGVRFANLQEDEEASEDEMFEPPA